MKLAHQLSIHALIFLSLLTGCSQYTIQGRVVRGQRSMAMFVNPDDPTLAIAAPLSRARVALVRDPNRLNRETVGHATSGSDGWFTLPVSTFGAGWLEEEWQIQANASGYQKTEDFLTLPGTPGKKVLVIIMNSGNTPPNPKDENMVELLDRYK